MKFRVCILYAIGFFQNYQNERCLRTKTLFIKRKIILKSFIVNTLEDILYFFQINYFSIKNKYDSQFKEMKLFWKLTLRLTDKENLDELVTLVASTQMAHIDLYWEKEIHSQIDYVSWTCLGSCIIKLDFHSLFSNVWWLILSFTLVVTSFISMPPEMASKMKYQVFMRF